MSLRESVVRVPIWFPGSVSFRYTLFYTRNFPGNVSSCESRVTRVFQTLDHEPSTRCAKSMVETREVFLGGNCEYHCLGLDIDRGYALRFSEKSKSLIGRVWFIPSSRISNNKNLCPETQGNNSIDRFPPVIRSVFVESGSECGLA